MKKSLRMGLVTLSVVSVLGFSGISASAASLESLGTPVTGDMDSAADYEQNPFQAASSGIEVKFKYEPHET